MFRQGGPLLILLGLAVISVSSVDGDPMNALRTMRDEWQGVMPRQNGFGLLLGAVIIVIAYAGRFNQWVDPRYVPKGFPAQAACHFTTRMNYWMGMLMYVGAGLALLVLCFYIPRVMVTLVCAIDTVLPQLGLCTGPAGAKVITFVPFAEDVAPHSSGALAFGVILPIAILSIPVIEAKFRLAMHNVALIPDRANQLFDGLEDNFERFRLHQSLREAFLTDLATKAPASARPTLYEADLLPDLRDEQFLEIYPRLEFYLWQISALDASDRKRYGVRRFKVELEAITKELDQVRQTILTTRNTVQRNFCEHFPDMVERMHCNSGIDPQVGRDAPSVTLLDNIVEWVADPKNDEVSIAQRDLAKSLLVTLENLGRKCRDIHSILIRIIVLMSLHGTSRPRERLRKFGLDGTVDRMEIEIVPKLILLLVAVALAVTFFFGHFFFPDAQLVILAHAAVMPAAGILGAYLIAACRGKPSKTDRNRREITRAATDGQVMLTFIGGLLAAFIAVNAMPSSLASLVGRVSEASFYTPVVALYGTYIAYAFFRQQRGLVVFQKRDLRVVFWAGVLGVLSALFHLAIPPGGNILALNLVTPLTQPHGLIWLAVIGAMAAVIGALFCGFVWRMSRLQEDQRAEVEATTGAPGAPQ